MQESSYSTSVVYDEERLLMQVFTPDVLTELLDEIAYGHMNPEGEQRFLSALNTPRVRAVGATLFSGQRPDGATSLTRLDTAIESGAVFASSTHILGHRTGRLGYTWSPSGGFVGALRHEHTVRGSRALIGAMQDTMHGQLSTMRRLQPELTNTPARQGYEFLRYRDVARCVTPDIMTFAEYVAYRDSCSPMKASVEVGVSFSIKTRDKIRPKTMPLGAGGTLPEYKVTSPDPDAPRSAKPLQLKFSASRAIDGTGGYLGRHSIKQIRGGGQQLTPEMIKDHLTTLSRSTKLHDCFISSGFTAPMGHLPQYVITMETAIPVNRFKAKCRLVMSGCNLLEPAEALRDGSTFDLTFLITVIPLNADLDYADGFPVPGRFPWNPNATANTGCIETLWRGGLEEGPDKEYPRVNQAYSELARGTDPWTQLPYNRRPSDVPITKGGLELDDIRSMKGGKFGNLYRNCVELTYAVLAALSGQVSGQYFKDSAEFRRALNSHVNTVAGPAISHSGKVWFPNSIEVNTPYTVTAEEILMRIVLSRFVSTGFGESQMPFHLWSVQDMHALKVPYSSMTDGMIVYTVDPALFTLLRDHGVTTGNTLISNMMNASRSYRNREGVRAGYSGPSGVAVVGKIMARPFSVAANDRYAVTHTVIMSTGQEVCLDAMISEMILIMKNEPTALGRGTVVWHPEFCIIVIAAASGMIYSNFKAFVIPGPRLSRFVSSYKNTSEVLTVMLDQNGSNAHFAQLFEARGYMGALLEHLGPTK
jgi:hypothetical protein